MSETFEVAGILGKRINKGVVEYRIEWKGYSIEDATWEPVDSLSSIKGIIEAYEAKSSKNGKGLFQSDSKRGKLKDKVDEKRRTYKKSTKSQSKDDSSEYDDSKIEEQPRTRNKNIARRSNTPPRFARRSGTPSPENAKPDTESFTIKLSEKLKKSNKLGDSKKEEEEANRARAERASRRIEVSTSKKDECSEE